MVVKSLKTNTTQLRNGLLNLSNSIAIAKRILFSSQGFPIFLTITVLGILFVLFRMRAVELDYEIMDVSKQYTKLELENKELKAKRAKLLSVKNLRKLASKYHLERPTESQVIVIP
ncbi:MAG: hypothetical protein ISR65_01510 [Bacteriovoracaceae bacterium]|nr:hypothetical protein [Bacteriovoracaceae bacterium]